MTEQPSQETKKARAIANAKDRAIAKVHGEFKFLERYEENNNSEFYSVRDQLSRIESIKNALKGPGVGFEALDPARQKDAKTMEAEFNTFTKPIYIRAARETYSALQNDPLRENPESIARYLKEAGVGFEALHPTGKKDAMDTEAIEAEVYALTKAHHIGWARIELEDLRKGRRDNYPEEAQDRINDHVIKAGAYTMDKKGNKIIDYSVLSDFPDTGVRGGWLDGGSDTMKDILDGAVKAAKMRHEALEAAAGAKTAGARATGETEASAQKQNMPAGNPPIKVNMI